jgi:carbon monoxide dehydrogenase subunit G
MELSGENRIEAPRPVVWAALNDPEVLRQCIPGCEAIEKVSDTEFTATVRAAVGPVKARFTGRVTLSDIDPPKAYTISGEGQGGPAGFAKGGAHVELSEDGAATILRYASQAQVGGKLAQIGSRLIQGTARKYAEQFFGTFAELVGSPAAAPAERPLAPEEAVPEAATRPLPAAPTPAAAPASGRALSPVIWIAAVVVVVVILLVLFH